MLVVIADDITGAAEIAGIGLRFGLETSLLTQGVQIPQCELLVYATDTRSFSEQEAIEETRRVSLALRNSGYKALFKKTDSALRGYIVPELETLLRETGLKRALLIPQNPSRGRIIQNGIYRIEGIPLHETDFAQDPEFPAMTSVVTERLQSVSLISSPKELTGEGVFIANATNREEIRQSIQGIDKEVLLAGGADLFIEYLKHLGKSEKALPPFDGLANRTSITVGGSTASKPLADCEYFRRMQIPSCEMPKEVFDGASPLSWFEELRTTYDRHASLAIRINQPPGEGKELALRLRNLMAEAVNQIISVQQADELIIEGGATAFAILNRLGWNNFLLTDEITPGVVRMSRQEAPQTHVTLKPGSYPWGENIFS